VIQNNIIFESKNLHWFDFSYSGDFDNIIELFGILQKGVSDSSKSFDQQIDDTVKSMGEDERNEYFEFVDDRQKELSTEYPFLMRRALLMITYSKITFWMHQLCEDACLDKKCDTPFPKNEDLKSSKSYIRNVLCITDTALDPYWDYLNAIRLIRNKFIHYDGHLSADKDNIIEQFIASHKDLGVEVNELGFLTLGSGTVESIAKYCQQFIAELLCRIQALDIKQGVF